MTIAPSPTRTGTDLDSADGDRGAFLEQAARVAGEEPVEVSIRKLLSYWDAKKRGYRTVHRVEQALIEHGLAAEPAIGDPLGIDDTIRLMPASEDGDTEQEPEPEITLRVRSIPSADSGLVKVSPHDDLRAAESRMMCYGYSQLPVLQGDRHLKGVVSWESIARARSLNGTVSLRDCIVTGVPELYLDDDLMSCITRIIEVGYALVKRYDNVYCGVVTTVDLSAKFAELAGPFFLLGEIERRLRRAIGRRFDDGEITAVQAFRGGARSVESADDLTFGEYIRLLENTANWERMWSCADRRVFIEGLQQIRETRNDIMHFSPDPPTPQELALLRSFIGWLRDLGD